MGVGYRAVIIGSAFLGICFAAALLLFLSVVPAALKIIEDEVRRPKAVSPPKLVGGQEGPWGRRSGSRRLRCGCGLPGRWAAAVVMGWVPGIGGEFLCGIGTSTCSGRLM